MNAGLQRHRIKDAPPYMYYIPDFLSKREESHILTQTPPKGWIALSHRRLQAIPSRLTANNTLLASPLPTWLTDPICKRFEDLGIFHDAPHGVNHCLINEYLPGQGIMPHEDGTAYHPVVATVSIGGTIVLDVVEKCAERADVRTSTKETAVKGHEVKYWRILQEPRSLLVTTGPAYTDTLHGITSVDVDLDLTEKTISNWSLLGDKDLILANGNCNKRVTRISLTYRDVKKVAMVGKILGQRKT